MNDRILIRGLSLITHIGVPAEERATPQTLRAHLTLEGPPFPLTDSLAQTINYKLVADQIRDLAQQGERQLLETLAQEIASFLLDHHPITWIRVELEKFILPETDWVGVTIERSRPH